MGTFYLMHNWNIYNCLLNISFSLNVQYGTIRIWCFFSSFEGYVSDENGMFDYISFFLTC